MKESICGWRHLEANGKRNGISNIFFYCVVRKTLLSTLSLIWNMWSEILIWEGVECDSLLCRLLNLQGSIWEPPGTRNFSARSMDVQELACISSIYLAGTSRVLIILPLPSKFMSAPTSYADAHRVAQLYGLPRSMPESRLEYVAPEV
jgi:hypothetical protein